MVTLFAREKELLNKKWNLELRLRGTGNRLVFAKIKREIKQVEDALTLTQNILNQQLAAKK